jgi:hypothetical protein
VTGTINSVGLSKGKCILKGDGMFIENLQKSADAGGDDVDI